MPFAGQAQAPAALPAPAGAPAVNQLPVPPPAPEVPREWKGKVVVSDVLLAPELGANPQMMAAGLRRMQRSVISGVEGFWRMHFVAFLERPAEGETLNVVATDVTDPSNRKNVRVFEVPADPAQRVLHMNNFVVAENMGFERGHQYEITVEKSGTPSGKQDVYARGVITLK
jgi:hypothetical protein